MLVIMIITVLWDMMPSTFHSGLNVYSFYLIFKRNKASERTFLKTARICLAKMKAQHGTLGKKYCWAIAQAVWRPYYLRSNSRARAGVWISNGLPWVCIHIRPHA